MDKTLEFNELSKYVYTDIADARNARADCGDKVRAESLLQNALNRLGANCEMFPFLTPEETKAGLIEEMVSQGKIEALTENQIEWVQQSSKGFLPTSIRVRIQESLSSRE